MAEIDDIFRALHDQMQQLDDPEGEVVKAALSTTLGGTMPTVDERAYEIVERIEADISGRHTLSDAWAEIDDDIRSEIREAWTNIIAGAIAK